jgi:hypothetical protein
MIEVGYEVLTQLPPTGTTGKVLIVHKFNFENEMWFIVASRIKPDPILHIRTRGQLLAIEQSPVVKEPSNL